MTSIPRLVGMVHLQPLPGSPNFQGSIDQVVSSALADAKALVDAGFPALMVENFGDAPFYADQVPPETVAGVTVAVAAIKDRFNMPLGVNVLRNDGLSALAVAAATGAAFVRINVLTGVMYTDQGPIVGRAAEIARARTRLCPDVEVWADVMVKHATPPPGFDLDQSTEDTMKRGMADAVIVSGSGTGATPDRDRLSQVRRIVGDSARLVVGSGATPTNLAALAETADTFIVGSSLKTGPVGTSPIDRERAEAMVEAAHLAGILS